MNIPGVSGAVREEGFLRGKHAREKFPLWSSRYCLEDARS